VFRREQSTKFCGRLPRPSLLSYVGLIIISRQHKPEVIFFGESIPEGIKERSYHDVDEADRLLVIGTTLATYSAFRLVKRALDARKPVMLINVGPTRADDLPGVHKVEIATSEIIRQVARAVMYVFFPPSLLILG
jgi:NAD-dependent SIR2 family protein deacetylase